MATSSSTDGWATFLIATPTRLGWRDVSTDISQRMPESCWLRRERAPCTSLRSWTAEFRHVRRPAFVWASPPNGTHDRIDQTRVTSRPCGAWMLHDRCRRWDPRRTSNEKGYRHGLLPRCSIGRNRGMRNHATRLPRSLGRGHPGRRCCRARGARPVLIRLSAGTSASLLARCRGITPGSVVDRCLQRRPMATPGNVPGTAPGCAWLASYRVAGTLAGARFGASV
jgi:hypothetical protein